MTFSRRMAMQMTAAFLGSLKAASALTPTTREKLSDLTLWYEQPAAEWVEAMPIGNGRLGAMIYGGPSEDRIQLNESTLWAGSPYQPAHKGAAAHLKEAQKLVFEGRYREAQDFINKEMMAEPLMQLSYQTVGSLLINDEWAGPSLQYRRSLDLESAVARIEFVRDRKNFVREYFSSAVDQVIVVRFKADAPKGMSFAIGFESPQKTNVAMDGNDLILRGVNTDQQGIPGKLRFNARVRMLNEGGRLIKTDKGLRVQFADAVTLLIAINTNFKRYDDISGEPEALAKAAIEKAAAKPYEKLLADHIADYQRLFGRVKLDLGRSAVADLPTNKRVHADALESDPALAALYYQFGRYLLISSSRPGGQAAGLQGLWNESLNAPWQGKYTININTEMNYWIAEPGNLPECVEPLLALVKDIAVTGQVTAKEQYNARGWVAHHNTDIWRATAPIDGAQYGTWPMGGAWLCVQLYDHYDYSRNAAFLKELYPLMKGASQFFLDTLVAHPKHGWMVTNPSMSPEHDHPFGTTICAGPAMDTQILRDLFDCTAAAAAQLKSDTAFAAEVKAMRAKLAPDLIGKAGQLQEWLEDWDMDAPDIHHRHVSHLYGLFPSSQFNVYDTPKLTDAAKKSLEIRGDEATGWGTAWRLNWWARLADGEHAFKILKFLAGPERTYPNMFDAHPPFQIDGNFGGANGISEMLLQSFNGQIIALPALPKAWPNGSLKGVRARGGVTADLSWKNGALERLTLTANGKQSFTLRYGGEALPVTLGAKKPASFGLKAGKLALLA
ncbi:alpha-L-fucosidase 2 [Rhizomicrobium palustre]|uniref:Alpha-L-fucosidase 2 n=1 Tax=Rhizomicrobium palustre TaxID=189966 RepID=A0A846N0V5_9PROT|nr:glycoside hydrolase family 95 protein [Rhizomicrobium palustre]NIK88872.1 alpha-L-fucosidase 2 [Rhizomicrobium palustre]